MNVLIQGGEQVERVELLLSLKSFRSTDTKDALKSYLVKGMTESAVVTIHGVDRNNFIRALAKLNGVAVIVESIKELDWAHFKENQIVTTLK